MSLFNEIRKASGSALNYSLHHYQYRYCNSRASYQHGRVYVYEKWRNPARIPVTLRHPSIWLPQKRVNSEVGHEICCLGVIDASPPLDSAQRKACL